MLPKLTLPQTVREDARPVQTAAMVLEAALDMHRDGTLDHLLVDRPGATRWLTRIFLQPILGAAGDALPPDHAMTTALTWLMEWAITQLRPDRAPTLQIDDRKAWLDSTSWRPAIAAMCHHGFALVPDFRDRYYRRPDETPADNLCGLWNIGPSTYYRYLEKAKRLMARALYEQRLDRRHTASLREFVRQRVYRLLKLTNATEHASWHQRQIGSALQQSDVMSALWHARQAGDVDQACDLIERHASLLATQSELDSELSALLMLAREQGKEFTLLLVQADIQHKRDDVEQEHQTHLRALKLAVDSGESLCIGIAYSRLGKYYESRDADRALSCYQDSVEFLRRAEAGDEMSALASVKDEYAGTLAKLAWLYILRNDPRAKAILEHADEMRERFQVNDVSIAMLEQCWGEYWRRAGDMQKALEHQHRTLNIYERVEDQNGLVKAYINLGLTYTELRNLDRAIDYLNRAIDLSKKVSVSSEAITSIYLNLGACYFWRNAFADAIQHYTIALNASENAHLKLHQARAHHNIAEAYYMLFAQDRNEQHERDGDGHAIAAMLLYQQSEQLVYVDAVKHMKAELLFQGHPVKSVDRLLPEETASNYSEASEISKHRQILATPAPAESHVRAHLAVANAYLAISAKEREAAIALIEKYGLVDQFGDELRQLHTTFNRELTREQRLDAQWKQAAGDFLDDQHRTQLLAHLFAQHFVNKSSYALLCGVSLATASKHLGVLAGHGLLRQMGKGPATKYVLSETMHNQPASRAGS